MNESLKVNMDAVYEAVITEHVLYNIYIRIMK